VVVGRCSVTAKTRLAPVLGEAERSALALAMLTDVVAATTRARLTGTIAVVDTDKARAVGAALRADVVVDPGAGMNAAVRAGIDEAVARGADTVLVLPSDIPLLNADDIAVVAAAGADRDRVVVVARDRQGVGTNALLLRPPSVIRPAFGVDSARHHLYRARIAGVPALEVDTHRLGFDVDLPSDLVDLRRLNPGGATGILLPRLREWVPMC
jgi:2-phospho-L-lactate guanylyltransferase